MWGQDVLFFCLLTVPAVELFLVQVHKQSFFVMTPTVLCQSVTSDLGYPGLFVPLLDRFFNSNYGKNV